MEKSARLPSSHDPYHKEPLSFPSPFSALTNAGMAELFTRAPYDEES